MVIDTYYPIHDYGCMITKHDYWHMLSDTWWLFVHYNWYMMIIDEYMIHNAWLLIHNDWYMIIYTCYLIHDYGCMISKHDYLYMLSDTSLLMRDS